tara:strand:- start:627 stop:1355 length:729 start_codon:yes stop_codon:yes gene_type:complete
MSSNLSPTDRAKFASAQKASSFVEDGMKIGLGTGSTAAWMVRCLAERVKNEKLRIQAVPTSLRTAKLATELGIKIATLDALGRLDLTIDGADEFDADLNLIKGGGGALLQEKIVAAASDKMIVIADVEKRVETMGQFPLPVEVIGFGWQTSQKLIEKILVSHDLGGRRISRRMLGDKPFVTDEGNFILDMHLGQIGDAPKLGKSLNQVPGVVENGLFINMCAVAVIGATDGSVELQGKRSAI